MGQVSQSRSSLEGASHKERETCLVEPTGLVVEVDVEEALLWYGGRRMK